MKKQKKVEFSLESIQTDTVLKKQLEGFIEEAVLSKRKIKTEQESLKDIVNEAKESLGIPGKMLNRLIKENLNPGTIEAEVIELETVQQIATAIES